MTSQFTTYTKEIQTQINQRLLEILDEQILRAGKIDSAYKTFWFDIKKYLLRGGKRLRPTLLMLGYEAGGGEDRTLAYELGVVVELIHAFLLIHDDIMDHDDRRYGGLNIGGLYTKRLSKVVHPIVAKDLGNSMAILAGDVLYSTALAHLSTLNISAVQAREVNQRIDQMIFEVAAGQQLDLLNTFHKQPSLKSVLKMYRYKTARYSMVTPLQLGAILAGTSDKLTNQLIDYGEALGLAFQLADDLLGMFGSARVIGKPVTTDLKEGKQTVLIHYGMKFANPKQKAFLLSKLGNSKVSTDDHNTVKQILIDNGARAKTTVLATNYTQQAIKALDNSDIQPNLVKNLASLANFCVERKQ